MCFLGSFFYAFLFRIVLFFVTWARSNLCFLSSFSKRKKGSSGLFQGGRKELFFLLFSFFLSFVIIVIVVLFWLSFVFCGIVPFGGKEGKKKGPTWVGPLLFSAKL